MGRTGTLWAYEQTGVVPDAITSAKALGGGLPIGALITGPRLADVLEPGDHGSTFAGAPVVAAAALAVLDVIDDDAFLNRVLELGERLAAGLGELPGVREVRGRGLMRAIEIDEGPALVRRALFEQRLVLNATGPATVRLDTDLGERQRQHPHIFADAEFAIREADEVGAEPRSAADRLRTSHAALHGLRRRRTDQ